MCPIDGGVDADAAAIHEPRLAAERARSRIADLPRGARRAAVRILAVARRTAVAGVSPWVDADTIAIDETRLARQAARAVVAD